MFIALTCLCSNQYSFTYAPAKILSVTRPSTESATVVAIGGTGFGNSQVSRVLETCSSRTICQGAVKFAAAVVPIQSWQDTAIQSVTNHLSGAHSCSCDHRATIPAGQGPYQLDVTPAGGPTAQIPTASVTLAYAGSFG